MNKIQFDRLLKPLVQIYDDIELELIRNILLRIENYSGVEGSLEWYLDKLNESKLLTNDNLKVIKKNKKDIYKVLKNIIDKGSHSSEYLDVLESYFNDEKIDVNPNTLYKGKSFNRVVENALKDVSDITDLINSKALESAEKNYKDIINKAYIETSSGIYTYQESIRKALNEFAKQGIDVVHYENGQTLGIEAVVRRDVITRVNKLVGDIDLQNAEELGTDLVYVDQHLGARTRTPYMKEDYEAHAEWQGKVYTINPNNKDYPNFYEATGYGEMLGLKGINCYHSFRPFFEWEKVPNRIDEVENAKQYELLQQQRAFERKIRSIKRQKVVANKEDTKTLNKRLKSANSLFNKYLEEKDLTRDYSREYIGTKK